MAASDNPAQQPEKIDFGRLVLFLVLTPLFLALFMFLRTKWEDETLKAMLAGCKEYTQWVRYRLIPGVW